MKNEKTWSTREAAQYLGISTQAMLGKVDELEAVMVGRGYRWSIDRVQEYARTIAGKSLNDPTR